MKFKPLLTEMSGPMVKKVNQAIESLYSHDMKGSDSVNNAKLTTDFITSFILGQTDRMESIAKKLQSQANTNESVISTSDEKRQAHLKAMSEKSTSFAGWIANNSKKIEATGGNLNKLRDLIDDARSKHDLKISDNYYNKLMYDLERKHNDLQRMKTIYSAMLAASVGRVTKDRR